MKYEERMKQNFTIDLSLVREGHRCPCPYVSPAGYETFQFPEDKANKTVTVCRPLDEQSVIVEEGGETYLFKDQKPDRITGLTDMNQVETLYAPAQMVYSIGDELPDRSIYLGVSPYTNRPYAMHFEHKIAVTGRDAEEYVSYLCEEGYQARLPMLSAKTAIEYPNEFRDIHSKFVGLKRCRQFHLGAIKANNTNYDEMNISKYFSALSDKNKIYVFNFRDPTNRCIYIKDDTQHRANVCCVLDEPTFFKGDK